MRAPAPGDLEQVAKQGLVQFSVGDPKVDQAIAMGYYHVNSGSFEEAVRLFTELLRRHPTVVAAYLGRGTAWAMTGRLKDAVVDFGRVIELEPTNTEGLRRRGQSLMALGELPRALADLERALALEPEEAEAFHQRGLCYFRMRDFARAHADFAAATRMQPTHREAWDHCGLALNQLGRSREAVDCHATAVVLDEKHVESHLNMGQAWKEHGDAMSASHCFSRAVTLDPENLHAHWLRGNTLFLSGRHVRALADLQWCSKKKPAFLDARVALVVVLQGRGRFREAVQEADDVLKRAPDHVVWYNRHVAVVVQRALDMSFDKFSLDRLVEDNVKEALCKRLVPREACPKQFARPLMLAKDIADVEDSTVNRGGNAALQRALLLKRARALAPRFQYRCPGFVANPRQHSMAGVGIIHAAQWLQLQRRSTASPHWRDFFDLLIRWRQLSEPNDPVWWVDLLPPAQFAEGFGSHTPIVTGQCRTVRYGSQLDRAMGIFKVLAAKQPGLSAVMRAEIEQAADLMALFTAMRRDAWVTTPCHSSERPGRIYEGTRITLQYMPPNGFEFSIRTPGTPPRMQLFDEELTLLWARLMALPVAGAAAAQVLDVVLRIAFFWYNCMPLSRGTAAIGLVSIHALALSFGWEIDVAIPEGFQCDWEAILTARPDDFVRTLSAWMLPAFRPSKLVDEAPLVNAVCATVRDAIAFLNAENDD